MGKLRDKRNESKAEANSDKVPRIEIELAGLAAEVGELETVVQEIQEAAEELLETSDFLKVNVFRINSQLATGSYTVPENYSAMAVGPVEIPEGEAITVPEGSRLVIL